MLHILNALLIGAALGLLVVGAKRVFSKLLFEYTARRENKKAVQSRSLVVDVEASPLKVIDFLEGGIEGRVVIFGPFNKVAKRILLLWKNGKYRCIRMDAVSNADGISLDDLYKASVSEAREIANKVFAKRKSKPQPATERAPPQHKEACVAETRTAVQPIRQNAPTVEIKPESSAPSQAEGKKREEVVIKGFKAQYAGTMVAAKVEPHIKTGRNGMHEEYESYTLTLDTEGGLERLLGNDLKRAIADADAKPGDRLKVLHIKDQELPNGFRKKQYQIINLSKTVCSV